jgi:nucleotide-binding universal stress UspA family protein
MKILLPLDGSAPSLRAVHHAMRLVREGLNASFVLANVQEPAHLYELMMARDAAAVEQASDAAGAHALQAGAELLTAAGLNFETEVGTGDPAHMLVEILENYACDAVIMSAHGAGTLRAALIGSVSQAMLHDSPVPVTIVREDEVPAAEPEREDD